MAKTGRILAVLEHGAIWGAQGAGALQDANDDGLEKDLGRIRFKYANIQLRQITSPKNEIQNPVTKNRLMENRQNRTTKHIFVALTIISKKKVLWILPLIYR